MGIVARIAAGALFLSVLFVGGSAEAATRPSAPRAVTAVPANQAATVTWLKPRRTGGLPITRYAVQRWQPASETWRTIAKPGARKRSHTDRGLTNGATYYYRVLARNRVGWSRPRTFVTVVPRTVPTAPRVPEADTYDAALGFYWFGPASTGGSAIDRWRAEISTDGATWTSAVTRATLPTKADPVLFDGLVPGQRYWLRAAAHNAAGWSAGSGAGPYRAYTTPLAPADLVVERSGAVANLSWTAPETDVGQGRPAASGYRVESSTDGDQWTTLAEDIGEVTYQASGLPAETPVAFRVSARPSISNIGYGDPAVHGLPAAPSAPTDTGLSTDHIGTTAFTWEPPATPGDAPVQRYEVEADNGVDQPTLDILPATGRQIEPNDATAESYRVRACNELEACGPWSAPLGPVPGQPLSMEQPVVTMDGATQRVSLAWTAPPPSAVAEVTGYVITRSADGLANAVVIGTTTDVVDLTFTDPSTDLDPGTLYAYGVAALSNGGSGRPLVDSPSFGPAQTLGFSTPATAVGEAGTTSVDIVLGTVSTTPVVVSLSSNDPGSLTVPAEVTIPAGSPSAEVELTGVDDLDGADENVVVTATFAALSDTVDVTVNDDDAFIDVDDGAVQLTPGASLVRQVALGFAPTEDVIVTIGSLDEGVATVSGNLVFTPENWSTPQPLEISGVGDGSTTVGLSSAGLPTRSISVTVLSPP